jgi:hypothetical protein
MVIQNTTHSILTLQETGRQIWIVMASKTELFPSPGITLRTERLISDFSTPTKELMLIQLEMLINGLSADGTLDPK